MAKKEQLSYTQILSEIRKGIVRPIYLLMGEEPYFMDKLTDELIKVALSDDERDFNQTIVYGSDLQSCSALINAARRYPMMAARQLVVLKEAQQGPDLSDLLYYAEKPMPSTILVINYKGGTIRQKNIIAAIEKNGIVFDSKKLYENNLVAFISNYTLERNISIENKAAQMMADSIGTDLSRLTTEMDKLITISQDHRITALQVEQNVGISKDFNNFELIDALIARNILKVNQIQQYFEKNPKANPFVLTVNQLFSFFSNLLLFHVTKEKTEAAIMSALGLKSAFATRKFFAGARSFHRDKCIEVIGLLRKYDRQSKGGEGTLSVSDADRLKELLYKILH